MQLNHNTGVIAIVIDGSDMGNPRVKTMPGMLQAIVNAAGINARVVIPEAVHTDKDANVAMSRNIDHISDGPQLGEQQQSICEQCGCGVGAPMSILDALDDNVGGANLAIQVCKSDTQHKAVGRSIESRYSSFGVRSEHPIFKKESWAAAIAEDVTEAGYWQWVNEQVELVLAEAAKEGLLEA